MKRPPNYNYLAYAKFMVHEPLKTMDATLQDGETGKDLGFIGALEEASYLSKGF